MGTKGLGTIYYGPPLKGGGGRGLKEAPKHWPNVMRNA